MFKYAIIVTLLLHVYNTVAFAQSISEELMVQKQDSLKNKTLLKSLGNGFFPTKFFDADLRYLIKFNQYEGIRTGLGGRTNTKFSNQYQINTYLVYGFRDHRFKYSIGGGFKVSEKTSTWIKISYTDDLQETGSTVFLTDERFFQFFEPRLLNIDLFYRHITQAIRLEHKPHPKVVTKIELATSNINPTYQYGYVVNDKEFQSFHLSTAKIGIQWSPFRVFKTTSSREKEIEIGYPKFTIQYTKNFDNVLQSNLGFSKLDFKTIFKIKHKKASFSEVIVVSGMARGNAPLTHLYHAYPNNIRKQTILQRFSVAGLSSFETMYFNEFFSDRFTTIQYKYYVKPFKISNHFRPYVVLISLYAIGDIKNPEQHLNTTFESLKKGYTESGFEINKLLYGFGLSFTYRYGAYHLPKLEDNMALKFTFNLFL